MSTSSRWDRSYSQRIESLRNGSLSRDDSRTSRKRQVSPSDAYLYALRVAYLAYLLQPRSKRKQHVAAPVKPIQRSSSSIHDLMKDFTLIRDSKSTRFPHGFMAELEKRLTGVMMGREKRQEYQDATVKRSFATYLNVFIEPGFKKRMEKDRRVEDLVLIFYSNATKVLQAGKAPGDDSWKLMVDRHVALFVRLLGLVLKDQEKEWSRDRPELTSRLATLESKLLAHDEDLAADGNSINGTMVEVIVPLSYEIKDMRLVQVVGKIFSVDPTQLQSDVNANRPTWTEEAALDDLKKYQKFLNVNSRKVLNSDDFDLEDAYEVWKKAETPDLSQMILAIVQTNPQLAKGTTLGHQSQPSTSSARAARSDSYSDPLKSSLDLKEDTSYVIDQPVDMSLVSPVSEAQPVFFENEEHSFTFIPPDPRSFYRAVLAHALSSDLQDQALQGIQDESSVKLLSQQSTELLNELCLRWRIPYFSRVILFLDVCREKFLEQAVSVETLLAAFEYVKAPPTDGKKDNSTKTIMLEDKSKWTISDIALNQQILTSLYDGLLRDLYDIAMRCYETKPPSVGMIIFFLETYIFPDPSFTKTSRDLDAFAAQLRQGLREQAQTVYQSFMEKNIPADQESWEFYNVIELGKSIMSLGQRIQKRYRRNPEIMGANPLTELLSVVLPLFAEDAREIVARILEIVKGRGEEVPVGDGFDLYKELVEIRRIHADALPRVPFAFNIEDLLAGFVWRWIQVTDEKVQTWVDGAVKQDEFKVRTKIADQVPTDEERHSVSVIDIFTSFNETISRIIQLNWDNELQYAKFMTALARIVGKGLAHYCDLVEQKFSREMDRLTPEQEANVSQTRQERWVQMAKDAWSNKEKVEPFQFFPESFVKLNNIAFSMRQLDKLEKEVNVDACVDVIAKNTPPLLTRQRKIANYVFTIKIVEAEDLKACDINGLSDPYVVLGDEYQKRLAKTRIIHANLNPRWDETVDITTQGPLNVVATVWDWDQLGEHDCVGRTSIKLDPSHFSDFMPREYWLDLDTQGRLLLRVSMEGERDDIQFYFGKAFRTLKRTERDMTRTITDKLSAYINYCLSRRALKSLINKPLSISSVSNYFNRNRPQQPTSGPSQPEIEGALKPLFTYFDDNFAIMNQTLTREAMIMVMARLWKEVLVTIESLVVPPLSDKPSQQKPLSQQELDIVFRWLDLLYDFFHAVDEETGEANGVPVDVLRSPKYFDIKTLNFFYFEPTDSLIRESERMASVSASRQQSNKNRSSAPAGLASLGVPGAGSLLGPSGRRAKSIMLSRNLGTMKKAKEEKRKEAQAEPSDDMILRILRMRPEAQRYLRDRSRQKERLAAAAAAEMIVKQSILAGGGRMAGNLPRR